ncbi:hypothetical protein ILT44_13665 [Microvirga sp. BT689]|uniref:hypothetical protein n=1 Tax=Microvirga arvi TaxID=2778731 RepID=UPI00194F931E|nr:hypothetical protein [Microvirga arvi]MBM6581238.1 hypothetical protein [Microvirga arvi]
MKISPPAVYAYDLTAAEVIDIIHDRHLRNCELLSGPVLMLGFRHDADLLHFRFAFGEDVDFADDFAFVRPSRQDQVRSFLVENEIGSRVTRRELLAVAFWNMDDKVAFDEELYISSLQP